MKGKNGNISCCSIRILLLLLYFDAWPCLKNTAFFCRQSIKAGRSQASQSAKGGNNTQYVDVQTNKQTDVRTDRQTAADNY